MSLRNPPEDLKISLKNNRVVISHEVMTFEIPANRAVELAKALIEVARSASD